MSTTPARPDSAPTARPLARVGWPLGMRREVHAVAESWHRSGRWLDAVACAIPADEWQRLG